MQVIPKFLLGMAEAKGHFTALHCTSLIGATCAEANSHGVMYM